MQADTLNRQNPAGDARHATAGAKIVDIIAIAIVACYQGCHFKQFKLIAWRMEPEQPVRRPMRNFIWDRWRLSLEFTVSEWPRRAAIAT